jgi:hypothetical protein
MRVRQLSQRLRFPEQAHPKQSSTLFTGRIGAPKLERHFALDRPLLLGQTRIFYSMEPIAKLGWRGELLGFEG